MKNTLLLFTVLFTFLVSSCKKSDPQPEEDLAQSYQGTYSAYYRKTLNTVIIIGAKPNYTVSIKLIPSGKNLVTIRVDETLNGTLYQTVFKSCSLKKKSGGIAIYSSSLSELGEVSAGEMDITLDINNLSSNFYATKD